MAPQNNNQIDGRMAFRFKTKEDFATGFHRIADEQISRAQKEWSNPDRAVAVHETRKCLKRLRSLLRLFRPVIETADFKRENARLRDVGRELSTSRDLQVMLEMTQLLKAHSQNRKGASKKAERIEAALQSLHERLANLVLSSGENETTPPKAKIVRALSRAGEGLKSLDISAKGFSAVGPGLQETYKLGRSAMDEVIAGRGGDEASHEWRKQVQAHWRQLGLLSMAWPDLFEARVSLARKLSEQLGQDHDLAVLRNHVCEAAADDLGPEHVDLICEIIDARQQELRALALADGASLYAEKPSDLRARVHDYWKTAKKPPSGKARRKILKSVEGRFAPAHRKDDASKAPVESKEAPSPAKTEHSQTEQRKPAAEGAEPKLPSPKEKHKKPRRGKAGANKPASSKSRSKKNRPANEETRNHPVRS